MPFHPPHFELVENGFLLTVETPSILLTDRKSALDFQYSVRKHFTNHLVVDGYIDRDCAIACDGSDGQIKTIINTSTSGTNAITITPTNLRGYTTITLNAPGETVTCLFKNSNWNVIAGNGYALA